MPNIVELNLLIVNTEPGHNAIKGVIVMNITKVVLVADNSSDRESLGKGEVVMRGSILPVPLLVLSLTKVILGEGWGSFWHHNKLVVMKVLSDTSATWGVLTEHWESWIVVVGWVGVRDPELINT